MNANEQQQLQRMIREGGVTDVTDEIRKKKHSIYLRSDMKKIQDLLSLKLDEDEWTFAARCEEAAPFTFREYADIFNRARKGNLDFDIMNKFIDVLEKIEQGLLGQHEGANEVGKLLKKIYIDSALKQANKLDESREAEDVPARASPIKISYKQFKEIEK